MNTTRINGRNRPTPHEDLDVEDTTAHVEHYQGVVRAGLGAVVYAGPGVVVDAGPGSEVHLAAGATLEEPPPPGALESLEMSVVPWKAPS